MSLVYSLFWFHWFFHPTSGSVDQCRNHVVESTREVSTDRLDGFLIDLVWNCHAVMDMMSMGEFTLVSEYPALPNPKTPKHGGKTQHVGMRVSKQQPSLEKLTRFPTKKNQRRWFSSMLQSPKENKYKDFTNQKHSSQISVRGQIHSMLFWNPNRRCREDCSVSSPREGHLHIDLTLAILDRFDNGLVYRKI